MRRTAFLLVFMLVAAGCVSRPAAVRPTPASAGPTPSAAPTQQPPAVGVLVPAAIAAEEVKLFKSPTCGCCAGHEAYLRAAGMSVRVQSTENLDHIKGGMGIPFDMRSCHTSLVGGYFVEGHVPLAAIVQLLTERPDIDGIALPGMPAGSPGMGGVLEGPLTVFAVDGGAAIGVFGEF